MKTFLLLLLLTFLAIVGCGLMFFQVEETEFVIRKLFGDPWRIIREPGLYAKWPWPVEELVRIDRRIHSTEILDLGEGGAREGEYLTRDKKNVLANFYVVWRVADPYQFLVSVTDEEGAESRLGDILRSEMGAELGSYDLSDLVSTGKIEEEDDAGGASLTAESLLRAAPPGETKIPELTETITRRTAEAVLREFGIEVLGVRLKRLNFPRQNKQAVFERMVAERERIAIQYRSEGKERAEKLMAEADRRKAELINDANRKGEEIRGRGEAEAARIYAEAYGKDPEFYEFIQTLETYRKIMDEEDIVVIPEESPLLDLLKEGR